MTTTVEIRRHDDGDMARWWFDLVQGERRTPAKAFTSFVMVLGEEARLRRAGLTVRWQEGAWPLAT